MEKEIIRWNIETSGPIGPEANLPEMPVIPAGSILIVGGRAPVWYYGRALHKAHGSPAGIVAFFDPRLGGGVVVASHTPGFKEGDVIPFQW